MAKLLTKEKVEARITMYDEVIDHLGMEICETEEEKVQAKFIQKQITAMRDKFIFMNQVVLKS